MYVASNKNYPYNGDVIQVDVWITSGRAVWYVCGTRAKVETYKGMSARDIYESFKAQGFSGIV